MRVAVTGTPGTGKTTATDRLETGLDVLHLNALVEREGLTAGTDAERDSWIADIEAIREHLAGRDDLVIESHIAHRLPADRVVVLRCHPEELAERLHDRGAPGPEVTENVEAERLDVILAEAVGEHGEDRVYEVETTDSDPAAVARAIEAVIAGERDPAAGTVSYLE